MRPKQSLSIKPIVLIFLGALLVGAVYASPDLLFMKEAGPAYRGIAPIGFRDETLYLARMNAVAGGDLELRNPAIYEHRNDPIIMPAFSEALQAGIGKALGMTAPIADMAATFVLPALLFILIAIFGRELSGSVWGGIAAAAAVMFGTHLFSRVFLLSARVFNGDYLLPLWFMRPITPQLHFIFFVSALLATYRSFVSGRMLSTILGGVCLGLLFYVSVFYWVFVYAVLGFLFLLALVEREYRACGRLIAIGLIAALVAVPYWLENMRTVMHPEFELLLHRYNIAFTHRPIVPVGALLLGGVLVVSRKVLLDEGGKRACVMMASMIAAVIATLNLQVVTGKLFKESHWTTYTGKFTLIVVGIVVLSVLLRRLVVAWPRMRYAVRAGVAAFLIVLLAHAIGMQVNFHRAHFDEHLRTQDMAGLFDWLREHAAGAVVLPSPSDVTLSELIPIYTKSRVYYSEPFFCLSLIPSSETRQRMVASYRLFDYTPDRAASHPYAWDGAIFLTSDTNRDKAFMDKERRLFREAYSAALEKDAFALAKRYRVDYVVAINATDAAVIRKLTNEGARVAYTDEHYTVLQVGGDHG